MTTAAHDAATTAAETALNPNIAIDIPAEFAEKPQSFARLAWKRFRNHRLAMIGVFVFFLLCLLFWFGDRASQWEADEINVLARQLGPTGYTNGFFLFFGLSLVALIAAVVMLSNERRQFATLGFALAAVSLVVAVYLIVQVEDPHWFGTDDIGRDLFVRAMEGGRFSIRISVFTALMGALLGALFGSIAGYFGGWADSTVNFVINTLLTMPGIVILLVLAVKFTMTPFMVSLIIAVLSWIRGARVVRSLILQFKEREFVLAARAAGARSGRIIMRHLMPNVAGALLVEITLLAGTAIILESTLSFLGLGVQPPATTLGTLIQEGKGSLDVRPSRVLIPGGFVTLIVLSLNFVGDGLRDALDPTYESDS